MDKEDDLKNAAELLNDIDVLLRVQAEDLIAKEAVYHHYCMNAYLKRANPMRSESAEAHHDHALRDLLMAIDDAILKDKKVFEMSTLLSMFCEYLPIDCHNNYTTQRLQRKLVSHYGDLVTVLTQKGQGKSNLIMSSAITMKDAVIAARNLKDEVKTADIELGLTSSITETDDVNLHRAAGILRKHMTDTEISKDYPGPGLTSHDESKQVVPDALRKFISWLIDEKSFKNPTDDTVTDTSVDRKCVAITECILACHSNKFTPFQLGLAAAVYHQYGSKYVVELLSNFGLCIPYHELRRGYQCRDY